MEYFVIGCLVIFILLSIKRKKYLLTPVTFFSGMWIVVLFLSSLKRYGMIDYSEKAIWLVLLSNTFFFIGNIPNRIIKIKKEAHISTNSPLYEGHYSINMTILYSCIYYEEVFLITQYVRCFLVMGIVIK